MAKLQYKRPGRLPRIEVVDLFCGIGGLSYGMKSAGFHILAGFDIDHTCRYAYETNTGGVFIFKDITKVTAEDILPLYSKGAIRVLVGCAPCQPFSSYAFKNKEKDPNKYDLLYEFGRLVREVKPDIVTMENVPAIRKFKLKAVLDDFIQLLKDEKYEVWCDVVYCPDYGIPQTRKRLVLIASATTAWAFTCSTRNLLPAPIMCPRPSPPLNNIFRHIPLAATARSGGFFFGNTSLRFANNQNGRRIAELMVVSVRGRSLSVFFP